MLAELGIGIIQGAAQALTDRFIKGRETSATIQSLIDEVADIKEIQARDRASLADIHRQLAQILDYTSGLAVQQNTVVFTPTSDAPSVEYALANLDLEISRLRHALVSRTDNSPDQGDSAPNVSVHTSQNDPSSILYRLDEEIANLRQGTEGDQR
ncbi:hypothetical protein ABZW11_25210 [Nonomuraea sp. NPDC004580]|uniref:hypothetical protein n=1 Tax=Nonomuraea sp. NPDC004580 TaxID=3154552 RepID=UPI0033A67EA0